MQNEDFKFKEKSMRSITEIMKLMDDICPKPENRESEIYERAEKLVSLQGARYD